MSDTLRGIIAHRVSVRAYHLFEFTSKMNFLEEGDNAIRSEILKLAPKPLKQWLEEGELLKFLYLHNSYYLRLRIDSKPFKNLRTTKKLINELSKAWDGIIKVELVMSFDKKDGKVRFKIVV